MPKIPPSENSSKSPESAKEARQRDKRPPRCHRCAGAAWWNGWRLVFPVVVDAADGALHRLELWLAKAKCSQCKGGFCIYPLGHYPRRQYQLDGVAQVTAAEAMGKQPEAPAPGAVVPSATSRRRWLKWVAELSAPAQLFSMAVRLMPGIPLGRGLSSAAPKTSVRARAAQVLWGLEVLGVALCGLGQGLGHRTGLGRVLWWQYAIHRDIYSPSAEPTKFSPAMAFGVGGSGM